jgi:hypothetical protein
LLDTNAMSRAVASEAAASMKMKRLTRRWSGNIGLPQFGRLLIDDCALTVAG